MTWRRVREFLKRYRFLLIVYVPALGLAVWEIAGRLYDDSTAPDPESKAITEQYTIEYSKLHRQLYPERPRSYYYQGLESLRFDKDLQTARQYFEAALATGIKTDEDLLYSYARVLVLLNEDPEKIDEAVRNWRINFPRSANPDPRITRSSPQTSRPIGTEQNTSPAADTGIYGRE